MKKQMEKISSVIESLATKVIMIEDEDNTSDLEDLLSGFNKISSLAAKCGIKRIEEVARTSAGLTAGVMVGAEAGDITIESISKAISCLQEMMRVVEDEKALNAVKVPDAIRRMNEDAVPDAGETLASPEAVKKKPVTTAKKAEPTKPETDIQDEMPSAADDAKGVAEGDADLLAEFISEATDHLEQADKSMLNLEENPDDAEEINAIFRAFHTIKGVAGFLALGRIQKLAHQAETLLDKARKGEVELSGGRVDVIFDSIDALKSLLSDIQAVLNGEDTEDIPGLSELIGRLQGCVATEYDGETVVPSDAKLGEILTEGGVVTKEAVEEALVEQGNPDEQRPLGEILIEKGNAEPKQVARALRSQNKARRTAGAMEEGTVKVKTGRLDSLVDMVGELVIAQAMVGQDKDIINLNNQRIERNMSHLGKITRELQELSMAMRMVPIQGTFQKMARLVRDLAKKGNKQIRFSMSGEETELDRNLVEIIHDPLVHMVRNATDHGIETPDERRQAGKPDEGSVHLSAYHLGGHIVVEIKDDGNGIDTEKLLAKARERGLVGEGQELTDAEIHKLVFHPGLTTAKEVTDVSGRGVGMDVVRKNIEQLRGKVDIFSEQGKGSTFTISVPLTLAIIEGMVIRVGKEKMIIPLGSIIESFQPTNDQLSTVQGRGEMINLRERLLPFSRFHRLYDIVPDSSDPTESIVIVTTEGNREAGFMVDEIIGQQQVVIKSLGESLQDIPGISGGTILGDGRVALIIDIASLIDLTTDTSANIN